MKKVLSLLLVMLILVSTLALVSCGGGGRVPVYQGMTIGSAMSSWSAGENNGDFETFANTNNGNGNDGDNGNHYGNGNQKPGDVDGDHDGRDDSLDKDNPYPDNDQNENIETEINSSLNVGGSVYDIYYAQPNEDIYIYIHIDNPDNYEIMSFTLNGKKYSDYMFEPGSDMETIILKYNVGSNSGIVEYTIDAIKYIDGTAIKDVVINGNKTVMAGIRTTNQVAASATNMNISANSVSFDVNVKDNDNLAEFSDGCFKAVLYDGDNIIDEIDLVKGTNSIKFENLKTNTLYQYAIVGYYDNLSGSGFGMNVLYKDAFYTESVVLFDNVVLGQDSVDFTFLWNEDATSKNITSLKLYKDGKLEKELSTSANKITGLLSNNTYVLVAEYSNAGNTESIYIEFTTFEKGVPGITLNKIGATESKVEFEIIEVDKENVGNITKIELIHNGTSTFASSTSVREFTNLLSNNAYTVRVTYEYDLHDGKGTQTIVKEINITTLAKAISDISIINTSSTQDSVSFEVEVNDKDNVGSITKVELIDTNGNSIANDASAREFTNLLSNNPYTVRVTYEYNLNDGKGTQTIVKEINITTLAKAISDISIINTSSTQDSVSFEVEVNDKDNVGSITKVELIDTNGNSIANDASAREFTNLLSSNTYTVRVTYEYNLNDGKGTQTIVKEINITTLAKSAPQCLISNEKTTSGNITADYKFTDIDSTLISYKVELYDGETLVAQNTDKIINFTVLNHFVNYTIAITYTYDLNDGQGEQTAIVTKLAKMTSIGFTYAVNSDGKTCTITGLGTCTDADIVIPSHIDGYKVTVIGESAFEDCKFLVSVIMPNTITTIGSYAFYYCDNLTTVVIPEGVTTIDEAAFCFCGSLKNISIPSTATNFGSLVFKGVQMTNVVIPDGTTYIPGHMFVYGSVQNITIPNSVTRIDDMVFYYATSLTSINFKGSIELWNEISKDPEWDRESGQYTIYCTDGQIAKDGTVTYN